MSNLLLINVDELWLKGGNRPHYFKVLKNHIKKVVKALHGEVVEIRNENQRFVATTETDFSDELIQKLTKVPGIHSIIPASRVESDMDKIVEKAIELMKPFEGKEISFRVNTKRVNKFFPKTSMETSRWVGHKILEAYDTFFVKLKGAEVILDVKVQNEYSYVSNTKFMAIGGLPVSSSGQILTLLSGGFDSPVASFMMSKRGCNQDFIFFYAYPYVGEEVKEKIIDMAKILAGFQNGCRLYVVPFGNVQKSLADKCKESYRTLLFRKLMIQTATALAEKINAKALLTGDSLGQVSSQTLGNISAIESIATIPILRPLIGMNKREIISTAVKIGTHDTSIIPHDDACAMFAPDAPVIRPDLKYWDWFHQEHDFSTLVNESIEEAEIFNFSPAGDLL